MPNQAKFAVVAPNLLKHYENFMQTVKIVPI